MAAPYFWHFGPDLDIDVLLLSTFMVDLVNCGQGRIQGCQQKHSTESSKEVNAFTPHERRELIDRLTHEEQNSQDQIVRKPGTLKGTVKYMARDFDAPSSFTTHADETTANGTTLAEWLNEARNMRAELPLTSDSVAMLRELREDRYFSGKVSHPRTIACHN